MANKSGRKNFKDAQKHGSGLLQMIAAKAGMRSYGSNLSTTDERTLYNSSKKNNKR